MPCSKLIHPSEDCALFLKIIYTQFSPGFMFINGRSLKLSLFFLKWFYFMGAFLKLRSVEDAFYCFSNRSRVLWVYYYIQSCMKSMMKQLMTCDWIFTNQTMFSENEVIWTCHPHLRRQFDFSLKHDQLFLTVSPCFFLCLETDLSSQYAVSNEILASFYQLLTSS